MRAGTDCAPRPAPRPSRPPDFEAFWARARAELAAVDAAPEHDLIARKDEIVLERLRFSSLGGARLEGYVLRWETAAMRPLVVHAHGYRSAVSREWAWARQRLNVAGVDVRGFGRSRAAVPVPSPWGWALTGIESPDRPGRPGPTSPRDRRLWELVRRAPRR